MTALVAAAVLCAAAGYLAGRLRPGNRLVDWADDQITERPARSPRFWLAVPLVLLAVAALWTVHPRRTLATYQDNKARRRHRHPAPTYDPGRAARHGGPQA